MLAPENTLAACRAAVDVGADAVEVDVRRTVDGSLVVIHDKELVRTTDVRRRYPARKPWRVAEFTRQELDHLDGGSWFHERFAGERVPHLSEVLDVVANKAILTLELKPAPSDAFVIWELLDQLRRNGDWLTGSTGTPRLMFQSFDVAACRSFASAVPDVPVGVLLQRPNWTDAELAELATWASYVGPSHTSLDLDTVARIHAAGLGCYPWTIDEPAAVRRALANGVDGVITNAPHLVRPLWVEPADSVGDGTWTANGWRVASRLDGQLVADDD